MDSNHSEYESESSDDEYGYKYDALATSDAPKDDGTVLDNTASMIDENTGNEMDEGREVGMCEEVEIPGKHLPMHYTSEDEEIQAPSSPGSWYH
ncbi:hypothetical protein FRC10_007525, partial [Ceratobasidium sp. 414]